MLYIKNRQSVLFFEQKVKAYRNISQCDTTKVIATW